MSEFSLQFLRFGINKCDKVGAHLRGRDRNMSRRILISLILLKARMTKVEAQVEKEYDEWRDRGYISSSITERGPYFYSYSSSVHLCV